MTAFEDLIASPDARARFLVEVNIIPALGSITTLVESPICSDAICSLPDEGNLAGSGTTLFLGDGHWNSKPSDSERPNASADARLISAGDIERTLPLQPSEARRAQLLVAQIEIANGDGALDEYVANWAPGGQVARSWLGPARGDFGDFQLVWKSFGDGWTSDGKKVRLTLKDAQFLLDVPLLARKYNGLGAEGGDPELAGQLIPQVWGQPSGISPKRINFDLLIYQIHDGPILSFDAIMENGLPFGFSGQDYPSINALRGAADPAPGYYHTCLAMGAFRLSVEPVGTVTCDVHGDAAGGYIETTGAILLRWAQSRAQINPALMFPESFADDVIPPWPIGIYFDGSEDLLISEAFDRLLQPVNGWYGVLRAGRLRVGLIWIPETTQEQLTLTYPDLLEVERLPLPVPPLWRQAIAWGRNWTPLSDVSSSPTIDAETRQRLQLQYAGEVVAESAEVRLRHRSSFDGGTMGSYFIAEGAARWAADRLMRLFRANREIFVVKVKRIGYSLTLNNVVVLTYPRFGLDEGKRGTIIGMREVADKGEVELTIWGGIGTGAYIPEEEIEYVLSVNGFTGDVLLTAEDIPVDDSIHVVLGDDVQEALDALADLLLP